MFPPSALAIEAAAHQLVGDFSGKRGARIGFFQAVGNAQKIIKLTEFPNFTRGDTIMYRNIEFVEV